MPPLIGVNETRRKPAARSISANFSGSRKFTDRFDQVLIGVAIAGHRFADTRDHVERIEIVQRVEPRHVDRGKFQAEEAPADPEHAIGLGECAFDARYVADAEGDA